MATEPRVAKTVMAVLVTFGCSSQPGSSNKVNSYGGNSGESGTAGTAGDSGAGGSGGSSGAAAGSSGIGGGISIEGGTGTDSGNEGCAKSTATARAQPAILELVVDTSGSMRDDNKWTITRDALLAALPTIPDGNALGLFFYPGQSDPACIDPTPTVPIAVLDAAHRQALSGRLSNQNPDGGTPTHDAYMVGLDQLLGTTLPGNKFLVLITDGAPTYRLGCDGTGRDQVDSTALIQQVQNAATGGIRTFVIGSPGSDDARGDLSRMASVGLTAQPNCSDSGPTYCHFDMISQGDLATALKNALAAITGQVLSCSYTIPQPTSGETLDPKKVNVRHNGVDIPRDPSETDCNTGWNYSADKTQIVLCTDACNQVKSQGGDIEIIYGCATKVF
jgi:hypothetical protein